MTLNCYKFEFFEEFHVISLVSEATTATRMKIDPYCQRQTCSPPNVRFQRCINYIDIAGRSSAGVYNQSRVGEKAIFNLYTR